MGLDIKPKQPENQLEVITDQDLKSTINNTMDRVLIQILVDSKKENDEPLRILEKAIFDTNMSIERLDIADSIILKLAYMKKS